MSQTMIPDEYDVYRAYEHPYQTWSSAPVGVLDTPQVGSTPPEQDAFQPPRYPSGPQVAPPPPRKRPGRAGAILLLTLVLALIFGVGLFAGWEFASNKSNTTTTSQTASTTSAPSASSTALQTQMEAAIAKVEPAVVELKVTTAQGEQIGSGVIIDAQG